VVFQIVLRPFWQVVLISNLKGAPQVVLGSGIAAWKPEDANSSPCPCAGYPWINEALLRVATQSACQRLNHIQPTKIGPL